MSTWGVCLRQKRSKFVENIENHFNSHTTAIFQSTSNLPPTTLNLSQPNIPPPLHQLFPQSTTLE